MDQEKGRGEFYQQVPLAGIEEDKREAMILEHCIVESVPVCRKQGTGYSWECEVYCPPDIFHQERNEHYLAHTKSFAKEARQKRLRPGDVVLLKGIPSSQEIEMVNGSKQTINHIAVSDMEVISRAKRESITVYEKKRGK